jgi:hypothetical protein
MIVPRRKIKRAAITHISLCRRGVNNMPVLMKSSGRVQVEMLTKAKEGILYALVYLPDVPDKEGDVATREVVKAMAHDFLTNMSNGGGIDIEHNLKTLSAEQVRIAETFIVQKADPRFEGWVDNDGKPVDAEGSWGIALKILDKALAAEIESGELNGVSMYGFAEMEAVGKSEQPLTPKKKMTPEEIQALAVALAKAITPAAAPAPVPAPVAKAEPVEFEGDPFNAEDVAKHAELVLFKSLDLSKPADLKKWTDHLAKKEKLAKSAEGDNPNASEISRLEAELAKLKKSSAAPVAQVGQGQEEKDLNTNLAKSEADSFKAGREIMRKFQGTK